MTKSDDQLQKAAEPTNEQLRPIEDHVTEILIRMEKISKAIEPFNEEWKTEFLGQLKRYGIEP